MQTPESRTNIQRIPEPGDASNRSGLVESYGNNPNSAETVGGNFSGSGYYISAPWPVKQESFQANLVVGETHRKRSAKDSFKTSKSVAAADSRLQLLSTGEYIVEPVEDSIKADMVFWYNLFMGAGKSQDI